jgi:hypothetical protein
MVFLALLGVLRGFSGCGVPAVRLTANPCARVALAEPKILISEADTMPTLL